MEERKKSADVTLDNDEEALSFKLIMASGVARSYAFEALEEARKHNFDRADELMEQSRQAASEAQRRKAEQLARAAEEPHAAIDLLLVHAQDHLMTSLLARELIEEIIALYRVKADKMG